MKVIVPTQDLYDKLMITPIEHYLFIEQGIKGFNYFFIEVDKYNQFYLVGVDTEQDVYKEIYLYDGVEYFDILIENLLNDKYSLEVVSAQHCKIL